MSMLTIPLSDALRNFVDEQVVESDFETGGAYVVDLIQRELDRERLRQLLLDGANSPLTTPVDDAYFEGLRERARHRAAG